jgi:predicted nucleic acid-binding Zn ribbon protein
LRGGDVRAYTRRVMRAIQQFAPNVLAEVIRRQPPSEGRTTLAWQVAVGAAIARATSVQLADGVLTVTAQDPRWVADVEASRGVVLGRLKQLLGDDAVQTLRITTKAPAGRRP